MRSKMEGPAPRGVGYPIAPSRIPHTMNLLPLLLGAGLAVAAPPTPPAPPPTIEVRFTRSACDGPFTGRVFVLAARQPIKSTPPRQSWFKPNPLYAEDVRDWAPEQSRPFRAALAHPQPFEKLPAGKYYLQAVLDLDRGSRDPLSGAGNAYSAAVAVELGKPTAGPIRLVIDRVIPERKFTETEHVKYFEVESKQLSAFHRRPLKLRAGVVLPKSWAAQPKRRYPVVYEIPGFGGDHFMAFSADKRRATDVAGVEMIHVVLDPSCRTGHHVFADSANNGPCGSALIEELIPALEAKFRGLGVPTARFVTGHSSGGWSSLWLQVTYPDVFGGTWSTAPDSVDFRDFQLVDLYRPNENLFRDAKGELRPLGRKGSKILLRTQPFSDMETVLGRGGQLFSFEAVFSPRGADGQPRLLWNRTTGAIDPETARTWRRYDIRLRLEQDWPKLAPRLAGKLHVYMGAEDTFYLDGATRLLQQALKKLGSDAAVEIFPRRDHGNLLDANLRARIAREMAASFRKHHKG